MKSKSQKSILDFTHLWRKPCFALLFLILCGASPTPLPSSSPGLRSTPNLNGINTKTLLKEFVNAQRMELKALDHRYKAELRELKASQDLRRREWKEKEEEARHKFLDEHASDGPEKRATIQAYIKDSIQRHEAFDKLLNEEWTRRKQEQSVHMNSTRSDQAAKLKEFKEALDKGLQPPQSLWPRAGR